MGIAIDARPVLRTVDAAQAMGPQTGDALTISSIRVTGNNALRDSEFVDLIERFTAQPIARASSTCPHCKARFTDDEEAQLTKDLPGESASCLLLLVIAAAAGFLIYSVASQFTAGSGQRN